MHQVTQHIVKLLYSHNCVVVPGLGGFVTNYQAAKMHPTSFIFNSPSKSIAFNVQLTTNDGLLVSEISRQDSISLREAEGMIEAFVGMVRSALIEHKPVKLSGIGRLTMDVEGNIRFLPDNGQNYLLQSYGLPTITAKPIVREKSLVAEIQATDVQQSPARKKRKLSDALLPIAAVLLLAMLSMQVFIQYNMNGFNYSEIFGFGKLDLRKSLQLERYEPTDFTMNQSIKYFKKTMTPPLDTVQLTVAPAVSYSGDALYFVSAGSFYSASQAQKVVDKIAAKGYIGYVKEYGKYQVAAVDIPPDMTNSAFRKAFIEATGIKGAWIGKN